MIRNITHHATALVPTGPPRARRSPSRGPQDADGRISLCNADAAAWSGWDEICQWKDLWGLPVNGKVSGLFLKEGKAKG